MKKRLSVAIVISLFIAMTTIVNADSNTLTTKSTGRIEYDSNSDGNPDVLFDASDITNAADAINTLASDTSALNSKYTDLATQVNMDKSSIINALNTTGLTSLDVGAPFTGDGSIVEALGTIPSKPTNTYITTKAGTGTESGAAGEVAINPGSNVSINLGIDQSITLPAGYYTNPITIDNDIKNIGAVTNSSLSSFTPGYYSSSNLDMSSYKQMIDLGTNTSFNVSGYSGYQSFTTNNFAIIGGGSAGVSWTDYGSVSNLDGVAFSHSPSGGLSMSYNSSTGILTAYYYGKEYGHMGTAAVHVYLIRSAS